MAMDKLSISLDESLTRIIREAAADEDLSVSAWLSAAAQDRIRNRLLRVALDADAAEQGGMSIEEMETFVRAARSDAIVTTPYHSAA